MSRSRVYVGNLPNDFREKDVEDIFAKYGKIRNLELKSRTMPPFAFIEFDDSRDAEDAVRGRDGYSVDGTRIRVEFTRGNGPRAGGGGFRDGGYGGGGGGGRFDDRERRDPRARAGGKRTPYRVIVSGLPSTGSWQDLKDHMREAGDVCYTDVFRDGTGIVEFSRKEDMAYAVRKLDDTKFKSHEGETSYVRVKEDPESRAGGGGRGRSRSRSRSRSPRRDRSRSRSRSARRSRSASPRRSPAYSPERSGAKSKSRSPSGSPQRSRSRSRSRS